ncbi:MAG: uracil-DNA glycosylase [Candidatus Cloacimonetes bacterium]|nr:uracil-DNA glycosylase [Candidatus Cloacimonadota bacterium]MBS3766853.1 uracil-DNA glycosylase [Candidatus Cloacimonadota bacterium]
MLEKLNQEIKNCTKCALHKTRNHAICGEGNTDSKLFLIPQAPGEQEDKHNKMFVGPSGKIFDELMDAAGITRDMIYMSNLIKCKLPENRKPKQIEIKTCSQYLDREIELLDPEFLVPLGYYSTQYIFHKYFLPQIAKAEFPEYIGKLIYKEGRKIFPLTHPAALIYVNDFKGKVIENYKKLQILLHECKWYQVCPMKYFYEKGELDRKWIELYCKGNWKECVRYRMEESGEYHSDRMLPNGEMMEG